MLAPEEEPARMSRNTSEAIPTSEVNGELSMNKRHMISHEAPTNAENLCLGARRYLTSNGETSRS